MDQNAAGAAWDHYGTEAAYLADVLMRVSCDQGDQGFTPAHDRFIATLNGTPVPHAITADEELGLVRVVDRDRRGNIFEHALFGLVKIERLH